MVNGLIFWAVFGLTLFVSADILAPEEIDRIIEELREGRK